MNTVSPSIEQFRRGVLVPLERLRRRLRQNVMVAGLVRCAAIALLLSTVQFGLDRLLILGTGPRAALLLILLTVFIHQFHHFVIEPARARIDLNDIAGLLERFFPLLGDRLTSSVAFATASPSTRGESKHRSTSHAMVSALIQQASELFPTINPAAALDRARHGKYAVLGLALIGFVLALTWIAPDTLAIHLSRNFLLRNTPWPSETVLLVEGMNQNRMRWPLGDDLTLIATATGRIPPGVRAVVEFPDGSSATREMVRHGDNQFIFEHGSLESSLRIRFDIWKLGVDESTDWYEVEAVPRPSIAQATLHIKPPPYTALPPFSLPTGQTSAEPLRGSSVRIEATLTKPVAKAYLRTSQSIIASVSHSHPSQSEPLPESRVEVEFTPSSSGSYFFDLQDADGLHDAKPLNFLLRIQSDPPPKVRLNIPGCGEMIVPAAIPELHIECEDNLALRDVWLLHQVEGEKHAATTQPSWSPQPVPRFEAGQSKYQSAWTWPLLPLGLQPGDRLSLRVRAHDDQPIPVSTTRTSVATRPSSDGSPPVSDPGLGESIPYSLKVVTPEELLADLGRRESEWRREFEQAVKSQEQTKRQIMQLHDQIAQTPPPAAVGAAYAQNERTQRQQLGRLRTIRRQFEQLLAELKTNLLANPTVRKRLEGGVIEPLGRLISSDIPTVAELMAEFHATWNRDKAGQIEKAQAAILDTMNAILTQMLKWEGYNEAVGLLQDIVRLQGDLNRETRTRLEMQMERLFGETPTTKPAPAPERETP